MTLEEGITAHSSIFAWRIPMNRGAWRATVHEVAKSQTLLSDFTFTFDNQSISIHEKLFSYEKNGVEL